jgi:pimeloyl-ACP methyl ester carboxylesterase
MPEYVERFFRSGTLRIHFRDWGDPALPPLVIAHGLRDHSHSFDDLARGLVDRFHVLAIDLRGHGDSETTPYYAFGHFTLDLHTRARIATQAADVIGHSMGGEVVARLAGSFPDVRKAVEGSARRSTTRRRRWSPTASPASTARSRAIRVEGPRGRLKRLPRAQPRGPAQGASSALPARARGDLRARMIRRDAAMMSITGPFFEELRDVLAEGTAPTLSWHGGESGGSGGASRADLPIPTIARRSRFREHTFVEIPGAGHMVHFDRPHDLLTTVRKFLAV